MSNTGAAKLRFRVDQWMVAGWEPAPWYCDGEISNTFQTVEDALAEIDDLVRSTTDAWVLGHMDEPYAASEYRVVDTWTGSHRTIGDGPRGAS